MLPREWWNDWASGFPAALGVGGRWFEHYSSLRHVGMSGRAGLSGGSVDYLDRSAAGRQQTRNPAGRIAWACSWPMALVAQPS